MHLLFLLFVSLALVGESVAQRLNVATRASDRDLWRAGMTVGETAGSQPLELTLRLGPTLAQTADLQQLLVAQTTAGSADYHHWLTPDQFQERFGWTSDERQSLIDWLASKGLTVRPGRSTASRIVLQGTVAQATNAFAVSLRQISTADGSIVFANNNEATLPAIFATHIVSLTGLDDLPEPVAGSLLSAAAPSRRSTVVETSQSITGVGVDNSAQRSSSTSELLRSLEEAVETNASSVLSLESSLCARQTSSAERAAYHLALQQAQSQGITVLVVGSCASAAGESPDRVFPSALSEVAAVSSLANAAAPTQAVGSETRPYWQIATGLPADGLRDSPDFSVSSLSALQSTVLTLVEQTGNRIGNLSPTLYALDKEPELFDHPESTSSTASATTDWTEESGLGTLNLKALLRLYPRSTTSTTTSLVSSSYSVGYGTSFILTATVLPSTYGTANPSGTVTFTSSTQGVLGSASVNSSGIATLTPGVLSVGTYTVTATYAGDTLYANSASTSSVVITVSIVNATLQATITPQTNVPYGATATVTATVTLPGANATPTGVVSAQIEGVTGALFSATLSPNSGVNSATANIVVSVPSANSYTVQVTCQGNTNFQCQTPVNLSLSTIRGYSNTSISVTPAAPQAGEPVSLTATVTNAGNGTGAYTFSGSVSFYDSGKLVATVPVATNQATATVALAGNRTHNIIAVYTGDTNWGTSTSTAAAVSPTLLTDTLTISSTASSGVSLSGTNLIFTATDTATATSTVSPTGTVTFYDTFEGSIVTLGSPSVLVPNGTTAGIALFNTTGLQPGTHAIYAVYSGDANYAPATSAVLDLSLSNFSLTMTPSTLTLDQGKSQGISVLVTASGGYTGTVSLGCVPPASSEATCAFSPSAVTGSGSSILTIVTTAPSVARLHDPARGSELWSTGSGISLAALLAWLLPRRSRRLPVLLAMILVTTFTLSALGCGLGIISNGTSSSSSSSSSSSTSGTTSSGDAGTPLGTQNFTITAAGSDGVNTVRHTYQYQVTIQ